jgi:hypothetical protein
LAELNAAIVVGSSVWIVKLFHGRLENSSCLTAAFRNLLEERSRAKRDLIYFETGKTYLRDFRSDLSWLKE